MPSVWAQRAADRANVARTPDAIHTAGQGPGPPSRRSILIAAAAIVVAVVLFVVLSKFLDLSLGPGTGAVRKRIDTAGPWGPVVFVLLLIASVVFAPIPNTPFFIAAGIIWGPWAGSALAMVGMAAGSAIAFILAQRVTRGVLRLLIGRRTFERVEPMARTLGPWAVFWARLLPITNFDWINYLAGLTTMKLAPFIIATTLGLLPATVATVVAGSAIEDRPGVAVAIAGAWIAAVLASSLYLAQRRHHTQ